jgi:hypothetical protein
MATKLALRSGWWVWSEYLAKFAEIDAGNVQAVKTDSGPLSGRLPQEWLKHLNGAKYVVMSYQTPIAWYVPNPPGGDGTGIWFIPDESYSQSTTRQQNIIRTAIHNMPAVLAGDQGFIESVS